MDYVMPKYGKMDWKEDDSWSDIILDDIYNTFYKEPKVAKESKIAKERKVAKEVIVISSSDDEVLSEEELTSDEELSSKEEVHVIASSKGPSKSLLKWYDDSSDKEIPEYYFSMSTESASKALKLKASTLSASKSKASTSKTSKNGTYYITCIKDGPFQPKTVEGANKPEAQGSNDGRRAASQDQHLKSIIVSCISDDMLESVVSYETAKQTWTDLVYSFEGPLDTQENRIMDLKFEYNTFKAKDSESLSHTYTHYKTLLNELTNDGVTLSKHEINISFTLDLADIYGRFVYEGNLISRRYLKYKKALDFQENFDDDVDERTSEEYLRDLDIEFHERALLHAVGKNHARNGEWIDITMRKEQLKEEECVNGKWLSSYSKDVNENAFIPASMGYDHEMSPKLKEWVERSNPNSKLLNFNTRRILVLESQAVNKSLGLNEAPTDYESSKESEYTWVYFLKKKSQAAETIMSFIKNVENQNDVKVKQIRTDNETEFRNKELESFCDEKGISQNFSSPYTPEQNSVVERKNKTLIEAARTMLNDLVLSKHLWIEIVEFKRISLTGFYSCTSRSRYRSVSKQTTRTGLQDMAMADFES
ncbi:retrovirus-related pol polyprotein from transposon TNT 1-94 [Tanacetum coccineum]